MRKRFFSRYSTLKHQKLELEIQHTQALEILCCWPVDYKRNLYLVPKDLSLNIVVCFCDLCHSRTISPTIFKSFDYFFQLFQTFIPVLVDLWYHYHSVKIPAGLSVSVRAYIFLDSGFFMKIKNDIFRARLVIVPAYYSLYVNKKILKTKQQQFLGLMSETKVFRQSSVSFLFVVKRN